MVLTLNGLLQHALTGAPLSRGDHAHSVHELHLHEERDQQLQDGARRLGHRRGGQRALQLRGPHDRLGRGYGDLRGEEKD